MTDVAAPTVSVTYPDGKTDKIVATELSQAVDAGAHPTTPEEANRAKYGDDLGAVGTFAGHAADIATAGLYTKGLLAGTELAGGNVPRLQHTIQEMDKANPTAGMIGDIGGLILGGEMIGGGGFGGRAAKGLEGALTREGAGALERYAVKGISGGVQGAIDQAQINVGHQVREDALTNQETTPGKLLAAVGREDVAASGILGGFLGAGGEYAGRLLSKGHVPSAVLDDAITGVAGSGKGVREALKDASTTLDDLQKVGVATKDGKQILGGLDDIAQKAPNQSMADALAEKYIAQHPAEAQPALRENWARRNMTAERQQAMMDNNIINAADAGTDAWRGGRAIREAGFGDKPKQFEALVDATKGVEIKDAAIRASKDLRDTIGQMQGQLDRGEVLSTHMKLASQEGSLEAVAKMADHFDEFLKREHTPAEIVTRLNEFKQQVGGHAGVGKLGDLKTGFNDAMEGVYMRTRSILEDRAVVGDKAAGMMKDLNAATSSLLEKDATIQKKFIDFDANVGGEKVMKFGSAKMSDFLHSVGSAGARDTEVAARDWIAAMRNQARAAQQHLSLTAEQAAAIKKGLDGVDKFEKVLDASKANATAVQRVKLAQADEAGKGLGGKLGFVVDAFLRPHTMLDRLAGAEKLINHVTERLTGGFTKIAKGEGTATTTSLNKANTASLIENVKQTAGNPDAIAARIASVTGDFARAAPQHAAAMTVQLAKNLQYLNSKAPVGSAPQGLAAVKGKTRYTDQQLSDFNALAEVVLDPIGTIEKGKMSLAQVQALQETNPPLYRELQQHALDQIAQLTADGKLDDMSYQQKLHLAIMLQVPADVTTTPMFVAAMQAAKQADDADAAAAKQGGGGSHGHAPKRLPRLSAGSLQTQSQHLEGTVK